jgi:class 3 adenylate cyclase
MFGDIGDAFMLVFRSARDAIRCAIGIQRAFAIRNQTAKPAVSPSRRSTYAL